MPFPPVPLLPQGVTRRQFADDVMQWGSGESEARARIRTLTVDELIKNGVTVEIASQWCEFYKAVVKCSEELKRHNPSAKGRADLMTYAVALISDH